MFRFMQKNHVEKASGLLGGLSELARVLGVSSPTVSQWRTGTRRVPAERCPAIERATKGAVTCEELRPDLAEHWAYLRGTAKVASLPIIQPEQEAA